MADTNARITDGRGVSEPKDGPVAGEPAKAAPASKAKAAPKAKEAPKAKKAPAAKKPAKSAAKADPKSAASAAPTPTGASWTDDVSANSGKAGANRGQTGLKPSAELAEEATLRDGVGAWKYQGEAATPAAAPAPAAKAADTPADKGDAPSDAPLLYTSAPEGGGDDLKLIKGVGPKLEGVLNDMGIYLFNQIAEWTPADVAWVDARLKFKGRIDRDGWIEQSKILGAGGATEFSQRSK